MLHDVIARRRWARWIFNGLIVATASASIAGRAQTFQNPPAPATHTLPALLQPRIDINTIVAANLFGVGANDLAGGSLARSSLNLVVTGLLATGDSSGMVVISVNGQPETSFTTGEDVMPGVRLHAVEAERIVIARGGTLETVPLKELEAGKLPSLLVASASYAALGAAPASAQTRSAYRAQLARDTSSQETAGTRPVRPAPQNMPKQESSDGGGNTGGASAPASGAPAASQAGPVGPPAGTSSTDAVVPRPKAGTPVPTIPRPAPGAKVPEVPRPAPGTAVEGPPGPPQ